MNVATVARQLATARPWPLFLLLLGITGMGFQLAGVEMPEGISGPSLTQGVTVAACAVALCAAILQVRLVRAQSDLEQLELLRGEIEHLHEEVRIARRDAEGKERAEHERNEARRARDAAAATLERRNVELQRVRDDAVVGMVTFDRTGGLAFANETFRRMLGYSQRELMSKTTDDLTAPEDIPRSLELSLQLRSGVADSASIEKRYVRKDGSVFESLTRLTVVRDDNGEPEMVLAQIEDRSERNRLRRELREAEEKVATLTA